MSVRSAVPWGVSVLSLTIASASFVRADTLPAEVVFTARPAVVARDAKGRLLGRVVRIDSGPGHAESTSDPAQSNTSLFETPKGGYVLELFHADRLALTARQSFVWENNMRASLGFDAPGCQGNAYLLTTTARATQGIVQQAGPQVMVLANVLLQDPAGTGFLALTSNTVVPTPPIVSEFAGSCTAVTRGAWTGLPLTRVSLADAGLTSRTFDLPLKLE